MPSELPPTGRSFWCFISYRHADNKEAGRQWATWLHQQIETYEVPADLVGTVNGRGDTIPERIFPVFRDEDELPANADLASPIYRALEASKFLVVLCSPRSVMSAYVAEEIAYYKKIGFSDRVLAAILDGEPGSTETECFPKPLQHPVGADGLLIESHRAEPIAADFRLADGTQGWTSPEAYRQSLAGKGIPPKEIESRVSDYRRSMELAKLKIIAGILGIPLGTLTQRDKVYQLEKERRRARIFRRVAAAMGLLLIAAVAAGVLAVVKKGEAEQQRREAVKARDAEAAQRELADKRRQEADEARAVAEARRKEADAAKDLAEQRRLESETRLARSNVLLADRLQKEGNSSAAREALWQVPEQERQWEWGWLLDMAYSEAHCFTAVPKEAAAVPQMAVLDPTGRRTAFWASNPKDDNFDPIPGTLRRLEIQTDGSGKSSDLPIQGALANAVWSRAGHLLTVQDGNMRIYSPDGRLLSEMELGEEAGSAGFLDDLGERFVVKVDDTWHLFKLTTGRVANIGQIKETIEGEKFSTSSHDGKRWVAVADDAGAVIYDSKGGVVEKFPDLWAPKAAIADDGSIALAMVDEAVIVRRPDGTQVKLEEAIGISRRNTTDVIVRWVGQQLLVASIHHLRSWDMASDEPENAGAEWPFDSNDIPVALEATKSWAAVGFTHGQIAIFSMEQMVEVQRLTGHEGSVADLQFVTDGCLASAGDDGTVRIWLPKTGVRIDAKKTIFKEQADQWLPVEEADIANDPQPASPGRPYGTRVSVTSADGKRAATTGDDGLVRIWNPENSELLLTLDGPAQNGESLACAKDGLRIGGGFFTPGNDWQFEQVWEALPWTRQASGISTEENWRTAFEKSREQQFREKWVNLK